MIENYTCLKTLSVNIDERGIKIYQNLLMPPALGGGDY
jgi:hypothetical protein